ncbi:MAG TPA: dynamin family protein [Thermoanaerobaculia bacterium]|nr:dynamin family protein [Thermoanaerobaculia bacterium]
MIRRVLEDREREIVAEEREVLRVLRETLAEVGAAAEDLAALDRSTEQLAELFLLVVVGEFNAGKSAFINALLGRRLLAEGVTPTTAGIHRIGYGDVEARHPARRAFEEVTAPVELLREIHIVDTPGTNAIQREHEVLTRDFIPRSDLVLFVTSADRPFTESERAFLQSIREWGKKVVVAINKIDILETEEDVRRVVEFVERGARDLLGEAPEVFPVSARKALRSKVDGDLPPERAAELWEGSRFEPLERYIVESLDERARVRLKLSNPLGVGRRLEERYREVLEARLTLLADDVAAIEDVERQLAAYQEDMEREFRYRLADVENQLHEFEARGMAFFDDTLRVGRALDLLNKARIKEEFERKVVADTPAQVEARVSELIDWLVAAELRQWQAVTRHVERRREHHADRIVGEVGGSFEYDRDRLLATVGKTAQRTIEGYDRAVEAQRMADSVQRAVAETALLEVGAIGLGTLVGVIATSAAVDVTGILAASALAILGLFVIPNRRRMAKAELAQRIEEMRRGLMEGLTGQFRREMDRSLARLREAISPYTRFVRTESEHLRDGVERLREAREAMEGLAARIEDL